MIAAERNDIPPYLVLKIINILPLQLEKKEFHTSNTPLNQIKTWPTGYAQLIA